MLLPFGVKILWFALSFTGLIGCWIVSFALARTIGSFWGLALYCLGCTFLEGILCLGMIWRMDPFSMPRAFCSAQPAFIALGVFITTGVVATFSFMTNLIVQKPKNWGQNRHSSFNWRLLYLFPTTVFPIGATAIYIGFTLKFNSVHPTREFYCDSSSPEWVRFLSYAGIPFILSIPSLCLSLKSVLRVLKINEHIKRARSSELDMGPEPDAFSPIPLRKRDTQLNSVYKNDPSPSQSLRFSIVPGNRSQRNSATRHIPAVHFHIPAKPPSSDTERDEDISSPSLPPSESDMEITSPSLSSLPRFTNPNSNVIVVDEANCDSGSPDYVVEQKEDWRSITELTNSADDIRAETIDWNDETAGSETRSAVDRDGGMHDKDDDTISEDIKVQPVAKQRTHAKTFNGGAIQLRTRRPPPSNLSPAIWRIILFQIVFVGAQAMGSLSTLIDVAAHRSTPMPLGTHHFAVLFIVWGPIFAFGSLPSVRQNIPTWRKGVES